MVEEGLDSAMVCAVLLLVVATVVDQWPFALARSAIGASNQEAFIVMASLGSAQPHNVIFVLRCSTMLEPTIAGRVIFAKQHSGFMKKKSNKGIKERSLFIL